MLSINSVNKMVVRDFSVNWTESNNPDEKRDKTNDLFLYLRMLQTWMRLLRLLISSIIYIPMKLHRACCTFCLLRSFTAFYSWWSLLECIDVTVKQQHRSVCVTFYKETSQSDQISSVEPSITPLPPDWKSVPSMLNVKLLPWLQWCTTCETCLYCHQ